MLVVKSRTGVLGREGDTVVGITGVMERRDQLVVRHDELLQINALGIGNIRQRMKQR